MTFVITDVCQSCKYTDCVAVCPVDAMYDVGNQLVINPDDCIDCGACEPECPTTAIFDEVDLPDDKQAALAYNAAPFESGDYPPNVSDMQEATGPSCS